MLAASLGTLPLVGPWLLGSVLAACCGTLAVATTASVGAAAAGTGAAGASTWWLAVVFTLLVSAVQAVRGRRRGHGWPALAVAAMVTWAVAALCYAGAVVVVQHLVGPPATAQAPTLP